MASEKGKNYMCELFGLSAANTINIDRELGEFYSHAPDHPNGWGIYYNDGRSSFFKKENRRADKSDCLKGILSGSINARNAIAHIRYATIGYDEMENTHPFSGVDLSGREWIFAHNGTIFESDLLTEYFYRQKGETDSERILLYMLDRLNARIRQKGAPLDEEERFAVLEDMAVRLSPKNKLNLLIYDGDILYAHNNCKDTLYIREEKDNVIISTTTLYGGTWEHAPFTRLFSYKEGKLLMTGDSHGSEYIPDPESIKALYLMYSHL